jgi:sugar/nucleoside kinase (ribokinase family)
MLKIRPVNQSHCLHGLFTHHINLKAAQIKPSLIKCNAIKSEDFNLNFVSFTLIVDDLVFWDGSTKMGQLGGGGAQTAWGFKAVFDFADGGDEEEAGVGLAAGVGPDVPESCIDWLRDIGVDKRGIRQHVDAKTPRAWQILERDGRRHEVSRRFFSLLFFHDNKTNTIDIHFYKQIWRTEQSEQQANLLLPLLSTLPLPLQRARAFHLGIHPNHPPLQLLKDLRHALDTNYPDGTGLLSIETFTKASTKIKSDDAELLWTAIELCDIFSPNEEEARSVLGLDESNNSASDAELVELTSPFLERGARWCALRRGADGAVVHEKSSENAWYIPSVADINVVDTTGCGNAFCGGFLAGIQSGKGAEAAGVLATATASIMAEHQGVPQGLEMGNVRAEVRRRALKLETRLL